MAIKNTLLNYLSYKSSFYFLSLVENYKTRTQYKVGLNPKTVLV
jgi:hypothetical protein